MSIVKPKSVELMRMSFSKGNELMSLLTDLEKKKDMEMKPDVVKPKPVELMRMSISTGNELMSLLNNEKKKSVSKLVIEEGCGNELEEDLKICGFENLKKLIVKKNSLKNLNSLVISNNDELNSIEIEDCHGWDYKNKTYYAPFENVKIVEIASMF